MRWYPVHTRPQQESLANRHLRRQGYVTFYPVERVRQRRKLPNRHKYRVEIVERPYFARYLFVGIHDRTPPLGLVNDTIGVSTLVYFGDGPLEIPGPVMTELMDRADGNGLVGSRDLVARKRFEVGRSIRFKDNSPLSGLIAQIAFDDGVEIRVWMDMLGARRQVPVDVKLIGEIARDTGAGRSAQADVV